MRKIVLTVTAVLTILFAKAQCQADFSYVQNGTTIVFTDLSFINQGWSTNYSVTWEWDFGDGTISTQQNPTHTYVNNGMYTPCLTVIYFDSVIINTCISIYCDSIVVGNGLPPSWDCNPVNGGCYDPGTGNGQYTTLAACQAVCGTPTPSWDCPINSPGGCYDPGTGNGQYTTLAACQAVCVSTSSNLCDSMTVFSTGGSPQTILAAEVPNINTIIDYWITTAPDGTVLGEDSMWNTHQIFNINPTNGQPFDTINVCITYPNLGAYFTCCVTWIWDGTSWNKIGSITNIGEINDVKNRLVKVVDVLGRETKERNQPLFYIYDDGTVEKKIIIE